MTVEARIRQPRYRSKVNFAQLSDGEASPISPSQGAGKFHRPPIFEMVTSSPTASFAIQRHDYPASCAKWNYHPQYELHLITASSGYYMIGDQIGTFRPGMFVLTGPNVPHNWFSDIQQPEIVVGRDVVLQFDDVWVRSLTALCPELRGVTRLLDDSLRGAEFLGEEAQRLSRKLLEMEAMSQADRLPVLVGLLENLARCPVRLLCSSSAFHPGSGVETEKIDPIVRYLISADLSNLKQSDVASRAGMSTSSFSRLFKYTTGDTFTVFMRRLRVTRACDLLVTTEDSIATIGALAGFSNLSNFNRYFLHEKGITPRQYRSNARDVVGRAD